MTDPHPASPFRHLFGDAVNGTSVDERPAVSAIHAPENRPLLTDDQVCRLLGVTVEITEETRDDTHQLMLDLEDRVRTRSTAPADANHLDRAGRSLAGALLLIEDIAKVLGARSFESIELPWEQRPVLHRAIVTAYSLAHDAEHRLASHLREADRG